MNQLRLIVDPYNEEIKAAAIGCHISCGGIEECRTYVGNIPEGYDSLEEWYEKESGNLHCWTAVCIDSPDMEPQAEGLQKTATPGAEPEYRETLTLAPTNTGRVTVDNATLFYYPTDQTVFCRVQMTMVTDLAAGITRECASVGHRHPAWVHALATAGAKSFAASIDATGDLSIRAYEDIPAGTILRMTGWWVVSTSEK